MKKVVKILLYFVPVLIGVLVFFFLKTDFAVSHLPIRHVGYFLGNYILFPMIISGFGALVIKLLFVFIKARMDYEKVKFWGWDAVDWKEEGTSLLVCYIIVLIIIVCLMIWGPLKPEPYSLDVKVTDVDFIIADVFGGIVVTSILEIVYVIFQKKCTYFVDDNNSVE